MKLKLKQSNYHQLATSFCDKKNKSQHALYHAYLRFYNNGISLNMLLTEYDELLELLTEDSKTELKAVLKTALLKMRG